MPTGIRAVFSEGGAARVNADHCKDELKCVDRTAIGLANAIGGRAGAIGNCRNCRLAMPEIAAIAARTPSATVCRPG
jgi:hypothetical protein